MSLTQSLISNFQSLIMNQVEALLHMLDSYDVSDRGVDVADVLSLPEPSMSDHIWQKLND